MDKTRIAWSSKAVIMPFLRAQSWSLDDEMLHQKQIRICIPKFSPRKWFGQLEPAFTDASILVALRPSG